MALIDSYSLFLTDIYSITGLLYGKLSVFLTFTPTVVPILYFYMVSEHSAN